MIQSSFKYLVAFIVLCLPIVGYSQYIDIDSINKKNINGKLVSCNNSNNCTPVNGNVIKLHKNGTMQYSVQFVDGKEEGVKEDYFDNGDIAKRTTYKNGKKEGEEKIYRENGKLKAVIMHENDEPIKGKCYFNLAFYEEYYYSINNWDKDKEFTKAHLLDWKNKQTTPCD
jgi:antitoxin component YwqK of YwqJK toxin-antitoxin module